MDEIVKQALAKWPNVPHCHGWLALDARGHWRMRDEHAQRHDLPGERITSPALIGFIQRNYTHDGEGRWYFQNGPQRVYVDLEAAPYVARTQADGFILQTTEPLHAIDAAWLTENGRLFLQGDGRIALLDDRDLVECLPRLQTADGKPAADEALMAWLDAAASARPAVVLGLKHKEATVPVGFVAEDAVEERFGFVRRPRVAG